MTHREQSCAAVAKGKLGNSISKNIDPSHQLSKSVTIPTQEEVEYLMTLFNQGRYIEGEAVARQQIEKFPQNGFFWKVLGVVIGLQGRITESLEAIQQTVTLMPMDAQAHNNLGGILCELNHLNKAETSCRRALEIEPDYAEAHSNLGRILRELGHLNEAEACYRRALEIKPDYLIAYSNLLFILIFTNHHAAYRLEEARRYGQMVATKVVHRFRTWLCIPTPKRLRIGLMSGDLRNHPVGFFLEKVLPQIDASRFELIAYVSNSIEDSLSACIKPYCYAWKSVVGLSDEAAANLIHADGVHLLLDLSGHTAHNRLPVFAWKPAPVQASWLGQLATTGMLEMDYLLGDPLATPPENDWHFIEKVWRLPEVWCCLSPPRVELEVSLLPALSCGYITFGSFNNLAKINDLVVALWARVLLAVPNSKLFIKTRQFSDPAVCEVFRQRFVEYGIPSDRFLLEGASPRAELLASYHRVDIVLDPFPCTGDTTNFEALWMGVPVITKKGDRFISRVGQSIVHNAGLSDWIAENDDDYVDKVVSHTMDLLQLAALRGGLRQQVLDSPLFDASRFARHLEEALWGMWEKYLDVDQAAINVVMQRIKLEPKKENFKLDYKNASVENTQFNLTGLNGVGDFCIKDGYVSRTEYFHYDDSALTDQYQLEVYLHALGLMKKYGFETVLDIGCGSGYKLVTYLSGYLTTGLELPVNVEMLKLKYPHHSWQVAEFSETLNNKFDVVICSDVIEHLTDPDLLLRFIQNIDFKFAILSTPERDLVYPESNPSRNGPPKNMSHVREWNKYEFNNYVSKWFKIVDHRVCNLEQMTQMVIIKNWTNDYRRHRA
jgi:predicted O-linked N-acetylglucosamine transferase (SPINDLY family)